MSKISTRLIKNREPFAGIVPKASKPASVKYANVPSKMSGLTGSSVNNVRPVVDRSHELFSRITRPQLIRFLHHALTSPTTTTNVVSYPNYSSDNLEYIPHTEPLVPETPVPSRTSTPAHTAASLSRMNSRAPTPADPRSTPIVRLSDGSGRAETPQPRPKVTATMKQPPPPPIDKTLPPFPFESAVLLIDVRDEDDFKKMHVTGSLNYPLRRILRDQVDPLLYQYKANDARQVVVIGAEGGRGDKGSTAASAEQAANALVERGWQRVYVATGGVEGVMIKYPQWVTVAPTSFTATRTGNNTGYGLSNHRPGSDLGNNQPGPISNGNFRDTETPRPQDVLGVKGPKTSLYKATFTGASSGATVPYGNKATSNVSHFGFEDLSDEPSQQRGQMSGSRGNATPIQYGHAPQPYSQGMNQQRQGSVNGMYSTNMATLGQAHGHQNRFMDTPVQSPYPPQEYYTSHTQDHYHHQAYPPQDVYPSNANDLSKEETEARVAQLQAQIAAMQMSINQRNQPY